MLSALLCLTACAGPLVAPSATPVPTVAPPAIAYQTPEIALPGLVALEREASIAGNLALLAQLWTDDARIVDGRNTPSSDDDYVWDGIDAVLDRYVVAVFPNPPSPGDFSNLEIAVDGAAATGVNGGDRWRFVQRDGRWFLAELRYQ